jgi:hypothetical protein
MSTVLDILTRAGRAMGTTVAGGAPSGSDLRDMLAQFQDIVDGLPLLRLGEWTDVILTSTAAYSASDGERINTAGFAATITLPTTYTDECNNTVPQIDMSRVQIIGGTQEGLYIYSASNGSWAQVDALATGDASPFGPEDTRGLACMVAVAMVDEYGGEVSAVTVSRAEKQMASLRARFYREVIVKADLAFYRNPEMGFRNSFVDTSH